MNFAEKSLDEIIAAKKKQNPKKKTTPAKNTAVKAISVKKGSGAVKKGARKSGINVPPTVVTVVTKAAPGSKGKVRRSCYTKKKGGG